MGWLCGHSEFYSFYEMFPQKQTNKQKTSIVIFQKMAKFLRIRRLLMDHDGISLDNNLKYKNIIICYYLLTILTFNPHRSPMRWLLLLFTFYYERSTKRGLKKVQCPFVITAKTSSLFNFIPHTSLCVSFTNS